jgi:hypothetical protein
MGEQRTAVRRYAAITDGLAIHALPRKGGATAKWSGTQRSRTVRDAVAKAGQRHSVPEDLR